MGKKTNDNRTSTSFGKEVFLIPVSDKGGMGIEQAAAFLDNLIASTKYHAEGSEDDTKGGHALITSGGYFLSPEDRAEAETKGLEYYDLREGEGKSAAMSGYIRMVEARTNVEARRINNEIRRERREVGYAFWSKGDGKWIDSEEVNRQREAIKAAIDGGATMMEPEPIVFRHYPASIHGDELLYCHNVFFNVTNRRRRFRLDPSNPLPLAGTVFDPRRYRQINRGERPC
ncbi:hypothetical protein V6R85_24205 [Agrobacterium sp. CCNWLW32]|uniref:hypothetical protein n=1 Tax=Agrobacterium sp. CCNWLW32 TaxID=3122072 RepID=UPI0030101FED